LCPASAATSPDGDLQAGHSVPTRLGWDQVTSTDGITLSDGDGRKGFAAVVFDYRQWGGSAGEPREELSFPRQREDYGTVIGWAAAQPRIDARRIFAWSYDR